MLYIIIVLKCLDEFVLNILKEIFKKSESIVMEKNKINIIFLMIVVK